MRRQLHIVLQPDVLLLEWRTAKEPLPEKAATLQEKLFKSFQTGGSAWLLQLGLSPDSIPSLNFWRSFAAHFCRRLALTPNLENLRHKVKVRPDGLASFVSQAPPMLGIELLTAERLETIWLELNESFCEQIKESPLSVADFLHRLRPDLLLAGSIFFHLVENEKGPAPFAFLATFSEKAESKHLPLKLALEKFKEQPDQLRELLSTVHHAAKQSRFLSSLLGSGRIFHPLAWNTREALQFLREVKLYETSGICCRIPDWWSSRSSAVKLAVEVGEKKKTSYVGINAIMRSRLQLSVGGQEISPEEAKALLEEAEGLLLIKNKWVAVDHDKLKAALETYEEAAERYGEGISLQRALGLALYPRQIAAEEITETDVSFSGPLRDQMQLMLHPANAPQVKPAEDFRATLRPYQQVGLNWLALLDQLQLGGILADDMGLGKTIQMLAFLSTIRDRKQPNLLIVPTSLLGNWQDEIAKFLPSLKIHIAHSTGDMHVAPTVGMGGINAAPTVITTYGMLQRLDWLAETQWGTIILDEAQAIKNPGTQQTRAVKELQGRNRIALTGTPIENKLSDLWSIFDFINPGLLGNRQRFGDFCKTLADKPNNFAKLRKICAPYILRRLKTDRSIIDDLPDKVEKKRYAPLSKRQTVLYKQLLDELQDEISESGEKQRKGLILSALMRFKQLCNHPAQYVGSGDYSETDSGKFGCLREICSDIHARREQLLVFTQFKEMCEPLAQFLETIFERPGLVLHGSTSVPKRRKMVDQFQGRDHIPFMVLSIKAGGVGLNLTRANHVIHFDRWWNPAIERQATDRAFRIGQHRNVVVHKLITRGTIEERIDRMLTDKEALSENVIAPSAMQQLTALPDADLLDLFTLE